MTQRFRIGYVRTLWPRRARTSCQKIHRIPSPSHPLQVSLRPRAYRNAKMTATRRALSKEVAGSIFLRLFPQLTTPPRRTRLSPAHSILSCTMNSLAAFTSSPLGALHFAHPASPSVLLQAMSASSGTTCSGNPDRPASSKFLPRLGFRKRATRSGATDGDAATDTSPAATRSACVDISAPVLISSSNPVACPAYSSRGPSYLLIDLRAAQTASKSQSRKQRKAEEEDKSEPDVPYSPTSPASLSWTSRPASLATPSSSLPSYTSSRSRDPTRPLVRVEEVERRLSEYDEEGRLGSAGEVAHKDGRVAEELKKLGL